MATTPRQRNARPIGIFATSAERDDQVGTALPTGTDTAYSKPVYGPARNGQASIHLVWSAGNTGTFTLWYSLNPNPELTTDTDWVQDSTVAVIGDALGIAGSAGKCIIFVGNVMPEWFRVKYVNASGAGSLVKGWARTDGDR